MMEKYMGIEVSPVFILLEKEAKELRDTFNFLSRGMKKIFNIESKFFAGLTWAYFQT